MADHFIIAVVIARLRRTTYGHGNDARSQYYTRLQSYTLGDVGDV